MNNIPRTLQEYLIEEAKYFPVVSLSGPRQAGKSTLLRQTFKDFELVSLEDPDTLKIAEGDPRGFLEYYSKGVIIDEVQRMPELFSYIQGYVDKDRTPGRFILSGSQNYLMHKHITQSLAGRVSLSTLLPLDLTELNATDYRLEDVNELMIRGFYPGKIKDGIPSVMFYRNYVKTYLERDVSDLISPSKLTTFRSFLRFLAHACGQPSNLSKISNDLDVSMNTLKSWLQILESSYIVFTLPPYSRNLGKRLIKSPKIYFYDIGLLCYLLDINSIDKLVMNEKQGTVFENFIISEKVKRNAHQHGVTEHFYFRDSNGLEIDLVEVFSDGSQSMTEIKAGKTFKTQFTSNLKKLNAIDSDLGMNCIYNGDKDLKYQGVNVKNWKFLYGKSEF